MVWADLNQARYPIGPDLLTGYTKHVAREIFIQAREKQAKPVRLGY